PVLRPEFLAPLVFGLRHVVAHRILLQGKLVLLIKLGRMPDCSALDRPWGELTPDELYSFLKLRTDVFFLEQKITETELDGRDSEPDTRHYWISDDRGAAAYLRTLRDTDPSHRDAH